MIYKDNCLTYNEIIYLFPIRPFLTLSDVIEKAKIELDDDDIFFLMGLYVYKMSNAIGNKVRIEALVNILISFLRHFNIKRWPGRNINAKFLYEHGSRCMRRRKLFLLLPLTIGEYRAALRDAIRKNLIVKEGKKPRHNWFYLNDGGGENTNEGQPLSKKDT